MSLKLSCSKAKYKLGVVDMTYPALVESEDILLYIVGSGTARTTKGDPV